MTIVTGAGRGLGRVYARRLAVLGAKIAVSDISLHSYEEFEAEARDMTGESTVAEIEAAGGTAIGIEAMSPIMKPSAPWWPRCPRVGAA